MITLQLSIPGQLAFTRRVSRGEYTIGRGMGADIRIKHDSVSRRHAQLSVTDADTSIRDLGGNKALRRKGAGMVSQAVVHPGDVILIGECELTLLSDTEQSAATDSGSTPAPAADATVIASSDKTLPIALVPGSNLLRLSSEAHAIDEGLRSIQAKLHELVLLELDLFRQVTGELFDDDLRLAARTVIERIIESGTLSLPADVDRTAFTQGMTSEITGFGPLEALLADDAVSEVLVNGPNQIFVEREGRFVAERAHFTSNDSLMRVIERMARPQTLADAGAPMIDARLPDGSLVNAILPPVALNGPVLAIRKPARRRLTMQRLVESGSLSRDMAEFLQLCVRFRKNIVVAGGPGSGKTTLLNALCAFIPSTERIATIEDTAELLLGQPNVISLAARDEECDFCETTVRELVRNALRMRPNRIIVGECSGSEILEMLQAMSSGVDGSLATARANSPRDLLSRLEVMVMIAGLELPARAIREQIASSIHIVVQLACSPDGRRRVRSIVELDGIEGDVITARPLFSFKQSGIGAGGEIVGSFVACGQAPRFYEELVEHGIALDRSIFADARKRAHV